MAKIVQPASTFSFVDLHLLPIAPFGSGRNPFYASGLGLLPGEMSQVDFFSQLEKISINQDIVIPSHFFLLKNRELLLDDMIRSKKKIWIQIELEGELQSHIDFIESHVLNKVDLQVLCFHHPSEKTFNLLSNLSQKTDRLEIVYFPYHYNDDLGFQKIFSQHRKRFALGYLPKGHKKDPFFSPLEITLDLKNRPANLRVYIYANGVVELYEKGLTPLEKTQYTFLRLLRFFKRVYRNPRQLILPVVHLKNEFWTLIYQAKGRLLSSLFYLRNSLFILFFFLKSRLWLLQNYIQSAIRYLIFGVIWNYLCFPLRKVYWFLDYQYKKRIKKELP